MVYRYALSFKRIFEDYVYFYKKVTREKLDSQIWGTMSRSTVIMVVVTPHPNTMSLRWVSGSYLSDSDLPSERFPLEIT